MIDFHKGHRQAFFIILILKKGDFVLANFNSYTCAGIVFGTLLASSASAQMSFSDLYGRTLSNEQGFVMINQNGTVTGQFGSNAANLTWQVEDGKFCREGSVGSNPIAYACQTIQISRDQVSFINEDGTVSSTYTIE